MTFDLVIRGGTVVDGSGLRLATGPTSGSSATASPASGRIRERGAREIDADGHVVTPGFIDGHTHMDAQVFWDPPGLELVLARRHHRGDGQLRLHARARCASDARALVVRNLERAEDIDPAALAAGIEWSWETFPEYLDAVDRLPKAINYAANIGHSALRTWAMGERAFDEEATDDDLALHGSASSTPRCAAGAIGFTTSRSEHHETSDDRPVASRLADVGRGAPARSA